MKVQRNGALYFIAFQKKITFNFFIQKERIKFNLDAFYFLIKVTPPNIYKFTFKQVRAGLFHI